MRGVRGPAELVAERGGVAEAGGLHDLEVLFVLGGRAGGDFVEPLAGIGLEAAEALEGGEELIVPVDALGGDEGAHGEAVDEVVVERLVGEGGGGGDLTGGAIVGLVVERLDEADGVLAGGGGGVSAVDRGYAKALAGGFSDEGFGVDGAGEMHVQVGTLGEGLEEGVEFAGAHFCGGIESAGGAGFAGGERGGGLDLSARTTGGRGNEESESNTCADHARGPFQCFECSKNTAAGTQGGEAVWSFGGGVAILWFDVLEGAIDR